MDGQQIVQRWRGLVSERETLDEILDAIERYIMFYRGRFFKDERSEHSIEWRKPWVFDSTAPMAAKNLAANIHTRLTSPATMWHHMRFEQEALNDNREAKEWVEACNKIVYQTLQESNFNEEINETYLDLVGFGTSIIVEEPQAAGMDADWDGVNFSSIPMKEGYFEEDHNSNIVNFYRHLQWTPLQIKEFCEENGWPCPGSILDLLADTSNTAAIDQKQDVIYCIFKRKNVGDVDLTKPLAPTVRPYGFKYVLAKDAEEFGVEGGYYEMPAYVPRWLKTSSSKWGNSPAMIAISDTITLNRMTELVLEAAEKVLDPPALTKERGLISDLDLNAGGLTVCRDPSDIVPYESGARFDVSALEAEGLRQRIREYFHVDQLILPPMQGTPATATEIATRVQQLETLLGPTLGRLQTDLLDPLMSRTFNLLYRAGQLPEMPQVVIDLQGKLDVYYSGPLARSQQMEQVVAIQQWSMNVGQLAQINPEVLDVPDWDGIVRSLGDMLGVPAKLQNTENEVLQARTQRKQQEQQMMDAQMAQEQGAGMQAMAEGQQAMGAAGGMPQ